MRLYAITDRRLMGPDPLARIEALARRHGADLAVQIRERDLAPRALYGWVEALHPRLFGASLFVNDRVDVARCFQGVGVHLPERGLTVQDARAVLGPRRPIGASAHRAADAVSLRARGADLVTLSPIFESPGKGPPIGLDPLAAAAPAGGIYALGGIDLDEVAAVAATGAAGVAGIRCFWVS